MVLKQSGAGPELVHCHVTMILEALVNSTVTLVGVGGARGGIEVQMVVNHMRLLSLHAHTSCWYRNHPGHTHVTSFITATLNINPDSVLCVALELVLNKTGVYL